MNLSIIHGGYMKTILVIYKDPVMRENTTEILELSNYRVLSEENLKRGFEVALDKRPDMIIFDDIIPKTKGQDLLKKLRQTAGLDQIPFILLTDSHDKTVKDGGLKIGPDEFLAKPFDGEDLLQLVAKCLVGSDE